MYMRSFAKIKPSRKFSNLKYTRNINILAVLSNCADKCEPRLIAKIEERFSHNEARMQYVQSDTKRSAMDVLVLIAYL